MRLTLGKPADKFKHLFERVATGVAYPSASWHGYGARELSVPGDGLSSCEREGRARLLWQWRRRAAALPRASTGSNTRSLVLGKKSQMRYKSNVRSIERLFDIS